MFGDAGLRGLVQQLAELLSRQMYQAAVVTALEVNIVNLTQALIDDGIQPIGRRDRGNSSKIAVREEDFDFILSRKADGPVDQFSHSIEADLA